jgi:hypothetical protein
MVVERRKMRRFAVWVRTGVGMASVINELGS